MSFNTPQQDRWRTFLLVSPPGAPDSSRGIASRSPRMRSGGVRCLDLKKFMVESETETLAVGDPERVVCLAT